MLVMSNAPASAFCASVSTFPNTMSGCFTAEASKIGPAGQAAGVAAIIAACIAAFLCFAATGPISRILGTVGMSIVVKVLGLILCALAIQFILMGLSEALPGMISGAVTTPYPTGGH